MTTDTSKRYRFTKRPETQPPMGDGAAITLGVIFILLIVRGLVAYVGDVVTVLQ